MLLALLHNSTRGTEVDKILRLVADRQQAFEAGRRFLEALQEADLNRDGFISLDEYKKTFIHVGIWRYVHTT